MGPLVLRRLLGLRLLRLSWRCILYPWRDRWRRLPRLTLLRIRSIPDPRRIRPQPGRCRRLRRVLNPRLLLHLLLRLRTLLYLVVQLLLLLLRGSLLLSQQRRILTPPRRRRRILCVPGLILIGV